MTGYTDRPWPVRGLIFTRNRKGRCWETAALERWLRLVRQVFKARKCEVLAPSQDAAVLQTLLEAVPNLDLRLSWRCEGAPSAELAALGEAGLLDVCAVVRGTNPEPLAAWGEACRLAGTPLRVRLVPPFEPGISHAAWAEACKRAAVRQVAVAAADPFASIPPQRNSRATLQAVSYMNGLAEELSGLDADAYLEGLPFCRVSEKNRMRCINEPQCRRDPAHFDAASYALAQRLWRLRPAWGGMAVQMLLGLYSAWPNPIDAKLLPWVLEKPWVHVRLWAAHKMTRPLRIPKLAPRTKPPPHVTPSADILRFPAHEACRTCRFRLICDRLPAAAARAYPGLEAEAVEGELAVEPVAELAPASYCDAVDAALAEQDRPPADLVEKARSLLEATPPTRIIGPYAYEVEAQWSKHSAGNVRWFSWTASEKRSTPLATLTPPAMVAVNLGDGFADLAGFSMGKHAKIAAPMTAFSHRFALYAAEDGRYVLLRDGQPVRPVEFAGDAYVPLRIGSRFTPRIALWNIDGSLTTQSVSIWEESGSAEADQDDGNPRQVSFVVVCTRFARRLEAVLHHLARQPHTSRENYEVIVAYVPGMDATLDVTESLQQVYPDLRIVTLPFTPGLATAKGIMINECVRLAKGEWVALLDADALIPPGLLDRLAALPEEAMFAVPDGRKMLSPETTAEILLGQRDAWAEWDALLHEAEEYRYNEADGVPIGFLQVARRACFDTVQYLESRNFEGADYHFGLAMRKAFGKEHRMSGMPVLHLDHGGSQWYGTAQHR